MNEKRNQMSRATAVAQWTLGPSLDPTAQILPLSKGQQIVAKWLDDAIAEPCDLADAIDSALREAFEAGFDQGRRA